MSNVKATKKAKKCQNQGSKHTQSGMYKPKEMIFGKQNYMLTIAAVAVIIIGFMLMSGKEGDIYDSRRTVIAPLVVLLGFAVGGFAILRKPKSDQGE